MFVKRLFEMASDESCADALGFSSSGLELELRNPHSLKECLPKYFKHKNVASLIRQLGNYGFEKIPLSKLDSLYANPSFIHPYFRRGRPELLHSVKRQLTVDKLEPRSSSSTATSEELLQASQVENLSLAAKIDEMREESLYLASKIQRLEAEKHERLSKYAPPNGVGGTLKTRRNSAAEAALLLGVENDVDVYCVNWEEHANLGCRAHSARREM